MSGLVLGETCCLPSAIASIRSTPSGCLGAVPADAVLELASSLHAFSGLTLTSYGLVSTHSSMVQLKQWHSTTMSQPPMNLSI